MTENIDDWCNRIIEHAVGGVDDFPDYPPEDVQKIPSNLSGRAAMEAGARFYRILDEEAGPGRESRILDFGCGWGRMSRFLLRTVLEQNVFGVDVEERTLQAAQSAMPGSTFKRISPNDPLPFESDLFDVVFGNSVFSHLSESANRFYMGEICRCLKKGGIAILSFLDEGHLDKELANKGWLYSFLGDDAQKAHDRVCDYGFFYKHSRRIEDYGIAYATHEWMAQSLPPELEVERFRTDYVHTLLIVRKV